MTIDTDLAVGTSLAGATTTWTWQDVVLYHLGLGAGADPVSPHELAYTYERDLHVLPTYAVILATPGVRGIEDVPGLDFDRTQMLHGEQEIEVFEPIPTEGTVETSARVAAIYDKGKAALVVLEAESRLADGRPLFVNRYSLFARGAGGFGGDPGPKERIDPPDREPDNVVDVAILPQQALLYRLSGDLNPLHAEPEFARRAGFRRPILHGLCSFGIACKAVVDGRLAGDPKRVARFRARFAGVVYPGETLRVRMWGEAAGIHLEASVPERDAPALASGLLVTR